MSKFIQPESYRVDTNVTCTQGNITFISETFIFPSLQTLPTLILNTDHVNNLTVLISHDSAQFSYTMPPFSTVVFVWPNYT